MATITTERPDAAQSVPMTKVQAKPAIQPGLSYYDVIAQMALKGKHKRNHQQPNT